MLVVRFLSQDQLQDLLLIGLRIHKKSREQFEIRTQKRLVIINYPTPQTVEALRKVDLPAGIDVEIKLVGV